METKLFATFFLAISCSSISLVSANADSSAALCADWLPQDELLAHSKAGDILTLRSAAVAGQEETRTVLFVSNNRVVFGPAGNGQTFAIGPIDNLFNAGNEIEGCINNKFDDKFGADPNSAEILKRALSQVGSTEDMDGLDEQQLANYGRYGHHNRTWIEEIVGQSSAMLEGEIGKTSLNIKEAVDGIFGKFTKMLVDKVTGSLKSSSAKIGAGSLKSSSLGSSLGGR